MPQAVDTAQPPVEQGEEPETQPADDSSQRMRPEHFRRAQRTGAEAGQQQRQRQRVRQPLVPQVDQRQRQAGPAQHAAGPQGQAVAIRRQHHRHHHRQRRRLDGGMEPADRRPAARAAPAQPGEARQRNQLGRPEHAAALLARRPRRHHRPPLRQPTHQHAEEAADRRRRDQRQPAFRRQEGSRNGQRCILGVLSSLDACTCSRLRQSSRA